MRTCSVCGAGVSGDVSTERGCHLCRPVASVILASRAEVRRLREELATVTGQRDAARKALEPFAETGNYLLKIEWTEDSYEEIHRTDEWTAAARALGAP